MGKTVLIYEKWAMCAPTNTFLVLLLILIDLRDDDDREYTLYVSLIETTQMSKISRPLLLINGFYFISYFSVLIKVASQIWSFSYQVYPTSISLHLIFFLFIHSDILDIQFYILLFFLHI